MTSPSSSFAGAYILGSVSFAVVVSRALGCPPQNWAPASRRHQCAEHGNKKAAILTWTAMG